MIPYEQILSRYIERDDRLIVMTAENRAPLRTLAKEIGGRFIDTGITEQAMLGMAAGLALRGRRPVVHALAAFLTMRAFEFIRTDIGIPALPVKIMGWVPGILSDANGPTHQAIEDIALMRGIPNMHVYCPSDEADIVANLPLILESEHPTYVRLNFRKTGIEHQPMKHIGEARVFSSGSDVNLFTYGYLLQETLAAADTLRAEGLDVGVTHVPMPKPFDAAKILPQIEKGKLTVTVEDHLRTGGLATIISEALVENRQMTELLPIAFSERWFKPGRLSEVMEYEQLTSNGIAARVLRRWRERV